MAVGKGSMARASKAAARKTQTAAENNAEVKMAEEKPEQTTIPDVVSEKATQAGTADAKPSVKKTNVKKTAPKKESSTVTGAVVEGTDEQVMKEIVYQSSSQVLNRDAMENETFGIGEAMPIYLF